MKAAHSAYRLERTKVENLVSQREGKKAFSWEQT